MAEERLQKILARAGIASRRKAEEYILAGRVTVNGKLVTELGAKADPQRNHIKVDGKLLRLPREFVYLALYKPKNFVTTLSDPQHRPTVMDCLKGLKARVFPVGRLDYHSEGLLLLTNDGDFAARILSPASHVPKTYLVKVNGPLTPEQEEEFRAGIPLYGRRTAPAELKLVRPARNPWYRVTLVEGRQNQIRIMFKHFGRLVEKLKRIRIGFLELGSLRPGQYRLLTPQEVARFRKLLGLDQAAASAREDRRHES
jgi:pseudouridine synthase